MGVFWVRQIINANQSVVYEILKVLTIVISACESWMCSMSVQAPS